jgi:hypothetical protein
MTRICRKEWWPRPESNGHVPFGTTDFKSGASHSNKLIILIFAQFNVLILGVYVLINKPRNAVNLTLVLAASTPTFRQFRGGSGSKRAK